MSLFLQASEQSWTHITAFRSVAVLWERFRKKQQEAAKKVGFIALADDVDPTSRRAKKAATSTSSLNRKERQKLTLLCKRKAGISKEPFAGIRCNTACRGNLWNA
ncbi:hypothetical protein TNCV_5133771 [Trichonephila clavipes]|nr:hypothetical protein TNCV_5133771 [Trichonephila clavipes]